VAKPVVVKFLDETHPCLLDQITPQCVIGAKALGDDSLQRDAIGLDSRGMAL
jgi:hypothetical protein